MSEVKKKRNVLGKEGRATIRRIRNFFKDELKFMKANNGDNCDLSPLKNILNRTAKAAGVNPRTVSRIIHEEEEPPSVPESVTEIRPGLYIDSQVRDMIPGVYSFLRDEYILTKSLNIDGSDLSLLADIVNRTAEATGISESVVTLILKEENELPSTSTAESIEESCQSTFEVPLVRHWDAVEGNAGKQELPCENDPLAHAYVVIKKENPDNEIDYQNVPSTSRVICKEEDLSATVKLEVDLGMDIVQIKEPEISSRKEKFVDAEVQTTMKCFCKKPTVTTVGTSTADLYDSIHMDITPMDEELNDDGVCTKYLIYKV